jgi:hypothetical protein
MSGAREPLDFPFSEGPALPAFDEASCTWHSAQHAGDRLLLRMGTQGSNPIAHDTRYGTLIASPDGASFRFDPIADADPLLVAKFVASVVRALVRQLRGQLSLHGSVVAFGDDAVAFVGWAFAGKSTLAHACVHHAQAELVADDTVAFTADARDPRVEPVQRGTWLLAESRAHFGLAPSEERKVMAEHPIAREAKRLRLVVLLEHHADLESADELVFARGVEAFRLVSPHIFRFAERNPEQHRRELDALADRLPHLRVAVLRRARRFDRLADQVTLVHRAVAELSASRP